MSKLPSDFVKAPAPRAKKPPRKATTLVAPDPRELLVHLTDDELRELETARAALERAGERLSLEQLVHRVLADWIVRRQAPAPMDMRDRLRALAAAPLRTWRELNATPVRSWRDLGATLRRISSLALH